MQRGRVLGRRASVCLRPSPQWFRGTRSFHELTDQDVGILGVKGLYELSCQPTLALCWCTAPACCCTVVLLQDILLAPYSCHSRHPLFSLWLLSLRPAGLLFFLAAPLTCSVPQSRLPLPAVPSGTGSSMSGVGAACCQKTVIPCPIPRDHSLMSSMT